MRELLDLRAADLLEAFAAETAAPAAGSAAALTAAVAAGLVRMVAQLTVQKADAGSERLRARYGPYRERAEEIATAADRLRMELQALVQEDAQLVEALVQRRRGQSSDGSPDGETEHAMVEVPLRTARAALQVSDYAGELFTHGYQSAAGDASVAVTLARAAAEASLAVAEGNLSGVSSNSVWAEGTRAECRELTTQWLSVRSYPVSQ